MYQNAVLRRTILLVLIGLLIWMIIPETHLIYRSVNDSPQNQSRKLVIVKGKTRVMEEPELYLVDNGTMYLLVREARSISFLLAAFRGRDIHWTMKDVQRLVSETPALAEFLPNDETEGFAIEWISD